MAKRTPLSKKIRFEIFKRDSFTCQYCGNTPPHVILEVDHIKPVAGGGLNDIDNLVTACFSCNRGKSSNSLKSIPQSLSDKAAFIAESEAQLRGYQEILESKRQRIEDELWRVAEVIAPGSTEKGIPRDWASSIKRFNKMLGIHTVLEAAEIALARFPFGGKNAFLYFCGICWKEIRFPGEGIC